jgi:hypothetical protein
VIYFDSAFIANQIWIRVVCVFCGQYGKPGEESEEPEPVAAW